MTTFRRYYFAHDGQWNGDTESVQVSLDRQCSKRWWYWDPSVDGAAFNRLQFSFGVAGRDQWWCHHRAMYLASVCYVSAGISYLKVPTPTWVTLPPHTNRGRHRLVTEPAPEGV